MKNSMYLSPLNIPKGRSGKWSIEHDIIPAYTSITEISHRTALFRGIRPKNTVLDFPLKIHMLKNNGGLVMSDCLQERFDHEIVVDAMSGKILIGGLGLGYVASLLDKKKSVTEITIVEKSKDVIKLVASHLHLKKLKQVHNQDIYRFLNPTFCPKCKSRSIGHGFEKDGTISWRCIHCGNEWIQERYDYIYIDIWTGTGEATLIEHVLPLRKLCNPFVASSKHIIYWQEDVMRGQVKFALHNRLLVPSLLKEHLELPQQKFDEIFNNKYLRIQKPFWNWVRAEKENPDIAKIAEKVIDEYVDLYGEPEFDKRWKEWM